MRVHYRKLNGTDKVKYTNIITYSVTVAQIPKMDRQKMRNYKKTSQNKWKIKVYEV